MESEKLPSNNSEITTEEKISIYQETLENCSLDLNTSLSNIPLLNKEEEVDFAKKIEEGDNEYKEYFLLANLRLVAKKTLDYYKMISKYNKLEKDDLFQEGVIGLMKAIDKFDYNQGYKFSTYATWWIESDIVRSIQNNGYMIRYPIPFLEKMSLYNRSKNELFEKLEREPTFEEIAEKMEISTKEVKLLAEKGQLSVFSINQPLTTNEDEATWEDILEGNTFESPENFILKKALSDEMAEVLKNLKSREREIIKRRYGIGYQKNQTLDSIGEEFGLTRERIRQIEKQVLRKLRILAEKKKLEYI